MLSKSAVIILDTLEPDIVTVDINPDHKPDIVDDAQVLNKVESNRFNRWRCDPPYNEETARRMYGHETTRRPQDV